MRSSNSWLYTRLQNACLHSSDFGNAIGHSNEILSLLGYTPFGSYLRVVYTTDHEVVLKSCKISDWLLNLSWDHFGLHQGKNV
jgi:hypothetical protein